MNRKLVFIAGELAGYVHLLPDGGVTTLGRTGTNDIVFTDCKVSRSHMRIANRGGKVMVDDLGSNNGSFVNGRRISSAQLELGDRVHLGDSIAELADVDAPEVAQLRATRAKPAPQPADDEAAQTHWVRQQPSVPTAAASARATYDKFEDLARFDELAFVATHKFCDACGRVIPKREVQDRQARVIGGYLYCRECADQMARGTIGPYRIIEQVGKGTTGAVYRAEHSTMRRVVAVKVLLKYLTADETSVQRFLREARSGAVLNHPNIVQTFDAGEDHGTYFIVMEYVQGRLVENIVKDDGPMPPPKAVDIAIQVARALEYAFEHRIVHRDLRPANIILTDDNIAKVIDMGMAKSLQAAGLASTVSSSMGTPSTIEFAAPEQIMAPKTVDCRTDIYTLGTTLYFMLAGQPPFRACNVKQYLQQITSGSHRPLKEANPALPDRLCSIVDKMMHKDMDKRYTTPAEFREELSKYYFEAFSVQDMYRGPGGEPVKESDLLDSEARRDMKMAKEIQQKLVPAKLPDAPGFEAATYYKPARQLSGDYLDFFPIGDNRYALMVADVAGKGTPGALVMAMVRGALRLIAPDKKTLAEVMDELNRLVCRDIKKGMFVTAIYGVLNANDSTLTLVSAGHNPPLVFVNESNSLDFLTPTGTALGVSPKQDFAEPGREYTLFMAPGDIALLYTDGVVEATNSKSELFGDDRLKATMEQHGQETCEEIVKAIVSELDSFRAGAPQSDDISIFIIRRGLD
ncbi:MAG: SpoIIE family protein phosphatase [Planctomycetota bacterium]|nr:SpoIIE family protein phosphatase [Planctomycetota bacterium]